MKKLMNYLCYLPALIGFLSIGVIFLPLVSYADSGNSIYSFELLFGMNGVHNSIYILIGFILALLGSSSIFLKKIYKDYLSLGCLFFLLSGFFFVMAPSFAQYSLSYDGSLNLSGYGIAYSCLLFFAALVLLLIAQSENKFSVYEIVETGMLVALAIGLDLPGLKIQIGSNGGSISFTMIPLFVLVYRQGVVKGMIGCGIVYGFITCVLDGWGLVYFPFDYLLGYGAIAIAGFFKSLVFVPNNNKFTIKGTIFLIVSVICAVAGRLAAATLSGMIFYEFDFLGSLSYNALYILPSAGICLAALIALYKPLMMINNRINSHFQATSNIE
jgi:thiamine transporter